MTMLPPRYKSPRHLGDGGMGEVYAAYDQRLRREVAVKILAERHCGDGTMRERFLREATLAASLGAHPHVVTVFDAGNWKGRPYFVMELAAGSVADRLRARAPDRRWALVWLAQAADALDAAHEKGIVHRDVKPANLLVDEYGAVRVSDFGIARDSDDTLTGTGEVLGTAGYLAPEQARGERCTPASDRFALAVVARELLTGTRGGELPAATRPIFERALADDAAERPSTCAGFVEAIGRRLEPPADDLTQHTVVLAPPLAKQRGSRVRRRLVRTGVVLAAVLGAAVSAVATYALAVSPGHAPVGRAAPRPTTCTASPVDHDANIVVRGLHAAAYCDRFVRNQAAAGDAWSYRSGRRLVAPDHGVAEMTLVCSLRDGRMRVDVLDSGSQDIGHGICAAGADSGLA